MIVDASPPNFVSYDVPQAQMEFAKNPDVQIEKLQFMLDLATGQNSIPGIIDELIHMFDVEKDPQMLDTIVRIDIARKASQQIKRTIIAV